MNVSVCDISDDGSQGDGDGSIEQLSLDELRDRIADAEAECAGFDGSIGSASSSDECLLVVAMCDRGVCLYQRLYDLYSRLFSMLLGPLSLSAEDIWKEAANPPLELRNLVDSETGARIVGPRTIQYPIIDEAVGARRKKHFLYDQPVHDELRSLHGKLRRASSCRRSFRENATFYTNLAREYEKNRFLN